MKLKEEAASLLSLVAAPAYLHIRPPPRRSPPNPESNHHPPRRPRCHHRPPRSADPARRHLPPPLRRGGIPPPPVRVSKAGAGIAPVPGGLGGKKSAGPSSSFRVRLAGESRASRRREARPSFSADSATRATRLRRSRPAGFPPSPGRGGGCCSWLEARGEKVPKGLAEGGGENRGGGAVRAAVVVVLRLCWKECAASSFRMRHSTFKKRVLRIGRWVACPSERDWGLLTSELL